MRKKNQRYTANCSIRSFTSVALPIAASLFLGNNPFKRDRKIEDLRGTLLVYMFLNESPRFPHVWLNVSDPRLKIGRIVNYANFKGGMVPDQKTCLCFEIFLRPDDALFSLEDSEIKDMVLSEVKNANILNSENLEHYKVMKFPFADAAVSWRDYIEDPKKLEVYEQLKQFKNLYNVQRPGTDRATYAGIAAAQSIADNTKEHFELQTDPTVEKPWIESRP